MMKERRALITVLELRPVESTALNVAVRVLTN